MPYVTPNVPCARFLLTLPECNRKGWSMSTNSTPNTSEWIWTGVTNHVSWIFSRIHCQNNNAISSNFHIGQYEAATRTTCKWTFQMTNPLSFWMLSAVEKFWVCLPMGGFSQVSDGECNSRMESLVTLFGGLPQGECCLQGLAPLVDLQCHEDSGLEQLCASQVQIIRLVGPR